MSDVPSEPISAEAIPHAPPVRPAGPAPGHYPPLPPPPPKFGWGFKVLAFLLVGSLLLNLLAFGWGVVSSLAGGMDAGEPGIHESYHSGSRTASSKIAVIRLEGMIMEGDGFVKKQIDRVKKDKNVKAIVLRVDSPGGTVAGSDFMYHHLKLLLEDKERNLPMVVSMGSLCASGGYYVSMAAGAQKTQEDVIFAEPTTWTGSIGVLIPHYDLSGLAERWDIVDDSVKSHELKAMGGMLKKMTPQEREIFKQLVDEMFDRFKSLVQFGRPKLSEEKIKEVATGQIFTTAQALKHGLVDKEGFIEEAIERAISLAGLTKESARVVKYKNQPTLVDLLTGQARAEAVSAAAANPQVLSLEALREAAVPRAYYMYSALPSLSRMGGAE